MTIANQIISSQTPTLVTDDVYAPLNKINHDSDYTLRTNSSLFGGTNYDVNVRLFRVGDINILYFKDAFGQGISNSVANYLSITTSQLGNKWNGAAGNYYVLTSFAYGGVKETGIVTATSSSIRISRASNSNFASPNTIEFWPFSIAYRGT